MTEKATVRISGFSFGKTFQRSDYFFLGCGSQYPIMGEVYPTQEIDARGISFDVDLIWMDGKYPIY